MIFEHLFPSAPQTQLAMFHTVFNVLTVLMIMPLTGLLIKIVTAIVPEVEEKPEEEEKTEKKEVKERLYYVDANMLRTPFIAVQQTKHEIAWEGINW